MLLFILAGVAAAILGFFAWAARRGWTAQTWASAAGGMLCYVWFGYFVDRSMHPPSGTPTHGVFVLLLLAIALCAGLRTRRAAGETSAHPVRAA